MGGDRLHRVGKPGGRRSILWKCQRGGDKDLNRSAVQHNRPQLRSIHLQFYRAEWEGVDRFSMGKERDAGLLGERVPLRAGRGFSVSRFHPSLRPTGRGDSLLQISIDGQTPVSFTDSPCCGQFNTMIL